MPEWVLAVGWGGVAALVCSWGLIRGTAVVRRCALVGAVHLVMIPVQLWFFTAVYPISDLLSFHDAGAQVVQAIRANPTEGPEIVWALLVGASDRLPLGLMGGRSSEMMALLAAGLRLVAADSVFAACVLVALLAATGKSLAAIALARAGGGDAGWLAAMIPSGVFWTAGLTKEAMAALAVGMAVFGAERVVRGRTRAGALWVLSGAALLVLFKGYLMLPVGLGVGAWIAVGEGKQWLRGGVGAAVGLGLAMLFAELCLDRFAPSHLLQQLTIRQALVGVDTANSAFDLGRPLAEGWVGQLSLAPRAIATAVFRPGLWEAHNAQAVVAGLENTVLVILAAVGLMRATGVGVQRVRSRAVVACLLLVVVAAAAIGLTTTNLGTLSRHRSPILLFIWFPVLVTCLSGWLYSSSTERPIVVEEGC